MTHVWRPAKKQLTLALYVLGFILYGVVFFLGLNQLAETRRLSADTAKISSNTNKLIKSQTDILTAIKGVADDTKITAEQQTAIIICMLQVPINSRTTDLQAQCREQATSSAPDNVSGTSNNSSGSVAVLDSSTQSTPSAAPRQSDMPQTRPNIFQLVLNTLLDFIGGIL